MARKTKRSRARPILAGAVPLALISFVVLAGSNSTTLPNGANLAVSIDDPVTCTEFIVPSGQSSIDVDVLGKASIGEGEADATFVYVMDVSGSTEYSSGSTCGTYLQCQKDFFNALNAEVIASGQADLVGFAVYGGPRDGSVSASAAAADMSSASGEQKLVAPDADSFVSTVINSAFSDDGSACGVGQYQYKDVRYMTNFAAGLYRACQILNDASNDNNNLVVVFASDGESNEGGGQFQTQLDCLKTLGATIESIAIGANSSCTGGTDGTLFQMADQTGGTCRKVTDPDDLPDIIPELIGSTLESLTMSIDGGADVAIPNTDISLSLPQPGAVEVTYDTPAAGLDPNEHTICVTANGSDVTGGTASVTQCEDIHLLQLAYGAGMSPEDINATNDLNWVTEHTVTAQIAGGIGPERDLDFEVTGQNAGAIGTESILPPDSKSFTYSVPQDCGSLGMDTITVTTVIAGVTDSIVFTKEWVDTVPPDVSCDPTVNPHGNKIPPAGKTNPDGFYQLNAEDPNIENCTVTLAAVDGDGYVFPGPFLPGDNIKYTQADGAPQKQKKIGSANGQAGAVRWHLIGHGDLTVFGTDPSGNVSSAICLVPPPPK